MEYENISINKIRWWSKICYESRSISRSNQFGRPPTAQKSIMHIKKIPMFIDLSLMIEKVLQIWAYIN